MANDTNNRYCQIVGTTSPFFRTKELITLLKTEKTKSNTTTKTTKETIKDNNPYKQF